MITTMDAFGNAIVAAIASYVYCVPFAMGVVILCDVYRVIGSLCVVGFEYLNLTPFLSLPLLR